MRRKLKENYMTKRLATILIPFLILGLLLSACERPATVASVTTPTSSSEIPFPVSTQPQIMKDILAATQTAAAIKGTTTTGGLTGATTSTPAFTYVTPTGQSTSNVISLTTSTAAGTVVATAAATATPTAIVYPTPTPGKPSQYTIQKGEFPYCIARRFNVNPADLLAANGLSINSQVSPGKVLTIPQTGSWPGTRSLKTHPTTYTVVAGDTIYTIACGFGDADPNTIMAANGLTSATNLTVGQVLQIP
jgi:LysM repeat protein